MYSGEAYTLSESVKIELKEKIESAWLLVYSKFNLQILEVCYWFCRNREDAKDIRNETLRIFQHIRTFDIQRPFYPWLLSICRNLCVDYCRKKRPVCLDPNDIEYSMLVYPANIYRERPRLGQIYTAMADLTPCQRRCLLLFYFKGYSYKEIAKISGFCQKSPFFYSKRSATHPGFYSKGGEHVIQRQKHKDFTVETE
ncbi:MAG: sigma-70 family RNA polymerase sigma factor [candidate division KSB1 bacterium]|nr:sigma-70 family RNA polymerase sigma factor [candidate division KSB1 bacterium]